MKKTAATFAASLLGLMLLAPFLIDPQTVEAQTAGTENHSYNLKISSPSNATYNSNSLLLNVTIHRQFKPNEYDSKILYSLNEEANVTVPSTETFFDMTTPDSIWTALMSYTQISGTATLQNLSEGFYCLSVYGIYTRATGIGSNYPAVMQDTQTVYFTINDGIAPSLTNMQIENRTYKQNSLPLNISVNKQVSWMGYSLDEKANVTFTGNMTLNGLEFGSHSLAVYANDTVGNMGTTENVNFNIEKSEVFPVLPIVIVSMAVIIVLCTGLLVYHKKHKGSLVKNF